MFTEERHRSRGYATKLMDLVAAAGDTQACVLYSDVGERIYARSGYVPVPEPVDWVLAPEAGEVPSCEAAVPQLDAAPPRVLQLSPTREQLDWAWERERLYARFLGRTPPSVHTARAGAAGAWWTASFKANELLVLWLTPGSSEETARVLEVARAVAQQCGLERVRLWGLPGLAPPPAASVQKRKEELAMFRPRNGLRIDAWRSVQRALWV